MDNHTPQINGALLRKRREELGWTQADLATRACLSNKQVKQIEEGGTSSFYSDTVKLTAAKKISGILGIPAQSLFVVEEPAPSADAIADQQDSHTPETDVAPTEPSGQLAVDKTQAEQSASEAHSDHTSQDDNASPAVKPYLKSPSVETTVIQKSTNSALDDEDKPKSKNSLWFIIALFVAALGLAAVMQQPAPTPPAEPPPPIQVLPPEQSDPAASAPSDAASALVTPVAPAVAPAPVASSAPSTPLATPSTAPVSAAPSARPAVVSAPSSVSAPASASVGSTTPSAPSTPTTPATPPASKP